MFLDVTQYTEPLARTPAILRAVIDGRSDAWLDSRHAPDVVSPREAVAHLVSCEQESWVLRARRILDPQVALNAFMDEADLIAAHSMPELLDLFASLRALRIQELANMNLTLSDLEVQTVGSNLGPYTVGNLLACWVAHDLYHLGQIFKSYSALYLDQIGPWQYYLNLPHFH